MIHSDELQFLSQTLFSFAIFQLDLRMRKPHQYLNLESWLTLISMESTVTQDKKAYCQDFCSYKNYTSLSNAQNSALKIFLDARNLLFSASYYHQRLPQKLFYESKAHIKCNQEPKCQFSS